MTLKQAQKKYSDARQITVEHDPYPKKEDIVKFVIEELGDIKVLDVKTGRYNSKVIYSYLAFEEEYFKKENERIESDSQDYVIGGLERLERLKYKPKKEPEKQVDLKTLNPEIRVGRKIETSTGMIVQILSIDEYKGIELLCINQPNSIPFSFDQSDVEKKIKRDDHRIFD